MDCRHFKVVTPAGKRPGAPNAPNELNRKNLRNQPTDPELIFTVQKGWYPSKATEEDAFGLHDNKEAGQCRWHRCR
jgi:hypothetical protein